MKIDFSQRGFFQNNPQASNLMAVRPMRSMMRVILYGQTDGQRHDEANSRVFFFCNFVKVLNYVNYLLTHSMEQSPS